MRHRILLSPEAANDLKQLRGYDAARVRDQIRKHLVHEPRRTSRSRIRRLRGLDKPQYRLRTGDLRVFYDVVEDEVHILAVVSKSSAAEWLEREGNRQ